MIWDVRSLQYKKWFEQPTWREAQGRGSATENERGREIEEKTWGKENRERGEWYSGRDEEAHASLSEEVILVN